MQPRSTWRDSAGMGFATLIAGRLRQWRSRGPASAPARAAHLDLGARGEELAAAFLRRNGYKVLYRNFRAPRGGEIDLVCRDKAEHVLAFVEVKTRSSLEYGRPILAVNDEKRVFIAKGALAWLRLLDDPEIKFRFDVVEVILGEGTPDIQIVRDAFALPTPYLY